MESELEMLQWLFSSHKDDLMISLACIDRAVMFMLSVQSTKKAARQHFFFSFHCDSDKSGSKHIARTARRRNKKRPKHTTCAMYTMMERSESNR